MLDPQNSRAADLFSGAYRLPSALRQKSFERMHLQAGQCVLDVGCGTGGDALALAHQVGDRGSVHGVDFDGAMIAQAALRARAENAADRVSYHHANATALPWPDNYFNASRCDRILQHMLHPEHGVDEQLRVTRPGGWLVVISGDWSTLSIDSDETDMAGRHAYFVATLVVDNPISGRCLRNLFVQRGLLDVEIDVQPVFHAVMDTAKCWQYSLEPAAAAAGLFASANVVMISGRKPPASA